MMYKLPKEIFSYCVLMRTDINNLWKTQHSVMEELADIFPLTLPADGHCNKQEAKSTLVSICGSQQRVTLERDLMKHLHSL